MGRGLRRPGPATALAALALFVALGGSVYAATRIDGATIKPNSLPGNRVVVGSLPVNRLQEGSIPGNRIAPGTITGVQVDSSTLAQVPSALHAESAGSARDAATATHATEATDAERLDGHRAGCGGETEEFAGACWQIADSEAPLTAPAAAAACAAQGGELPDPLALAAYALRPGVGLAPGDEWSGDIPTISGLNVYGVATVSSAGKIGFANSTETKKYRCVIPLLG